MKKLMALIVIIMLFAMAAQAVDNPFSFSLYNQVKAKAQDHSQMGRMTDSESNISYAPMYDFVVEKAVLFDEMQCKASITLAEIYTMGFYLMGMAEIGWGGDADRVGFKVGMDNGIQAVPDYLKIDINAAWEVQWNDATYIEMYLKPYLGLGGKIPDTGISWSISEAIELHWNPENWKDTDPTYNSWNGNAYSSATGALIVSTDYTTSDGDPIDDSAPYVVAQEGAFDYAKFESKVTFDFEFFHFFAPENIKGTLKLMNNFKVKVPYSYYLEKCKELNDEFEVGFELALAGPTVYVALWGETADFLNTSAPLDGDNGSHYSWEGRWLGNDGELDNNDNEGQVNVVWTGEFDDKDAVSHGRPNLKIGPKINFSYSKEWFSFGTEYKGYLDGIRKWDEDGLNAALAWKNEFAIFAKFAL